MDNSFKSDASKLAWEMYLLDPKKNFNYLRLYLAVEYADESVLSNSSSNDDEMER